MNRRGFMKLLALTPLAGLLKPEPEKMIQIRFKGTEPDTAHVKVYEIWHKDFGPKPVIAVADLEMR